ncbi:replication initiation protein [Vibrio tubiashii]|jgi:plasmid replication initiation protein|uniref:Replication initiation protein n=3 Tax=Vibrio oreintalis group TaxID=1891919 RepID=A0AAE7AWN5_9VIBR|nr:replication protein [Vibrio tubiashii ATCC 19109]KLN65957.1 replication protein [Vibrio sp. VPAP30]NOH22586.1 replication initiation protein [Vibrio europaeus]NOI80899.1 replication initiation protein [Vibrio tubiashii]QJY38113.1 replication initiation protein [Vibrio europaeus]
MCHPTLHVKQKSLPEQTKLSGMSTNPKNLPKHIKKGHELVFSQQDLTAREANLFGLMVANMKPEDWDNQGKTPEYRFTASQLSEWLGLNNRAIGSQLKQVVSRLASRKIGIIIEKQGDTEFEFTPLFKKATYKDRVLTLIPNDALSKEYIEYNQGFSLINTKSFLGLKREYTKRLYEILSRFKTDGTNLKPIEIDDLRAFMGLLNEDGSLKANKSSFKNTSVFLSRCIKESIEELSEDPKTSKEILFLESEDGLGIRLHKHGRNIHAVEFLYRWINNANPAQKLHFEDAKRNITRLETKRLTTDEPLTTEELELLSYSYRSIDEDDKAAFVDQALMSRQSSGNGDVTPELVDGDDDDKSFLDKLAELERINGAKGY